MEQSYCYPDEYMNKKRKRHWSHISKGSKYAYFGNYDDVCYDYNVVNWLRNKKGE